MMHRIDAGLAVRALVRTGVSIAAALAVLAGLSCVNTSVVQKTRADPDKSESALGDQTTHTSTIYADRDEGTLENGRNERRAGHYDAAIALFQRVADNPSARSNLREQALLELGHAWSDLLNPGKDMDRALAAYRRLVNEFPESSLRGDAETAIRELTGGGS